MKCIQSLHNKPYNLIIFLFICLLFTLIIAVGDLHKFKALSDHFESGKPITMHLFAPDSRPPSVRWTLQCIDNSHDDQPRKRLSVQEEPIYTGLPIKLQRKKRVDLMDIETQQVRIF